MFYVHDSVVYKKMAFLVQDNCKLVCLGQQQIGIDKAFIQRPRCDMDTVSQSSDHWIAFDAQN